jgi:transposase
MTIPLTPEQKLALKALHLTLKDKRKADRLKIVVMLDKGYSISQISEALMLDVDTISKWEHRFLQSVSFGEFLNFKFHRYSGKLNELQIVELKKFINSEIIHDSKQIKQFILEKFNIHFTSSGVKSLIHRLGFSYKYLVKFNSKTSVELQEEFVEDFKNLSETLENTDSILFLDGVHPQHNTGSSKAWIEKGKERFIECNTGRQRLNINGAYDPMTNNVIITQGDSINSENTIELFKKIEEQYKDKKTIFAFSDNAKYYKSKLVSEYLKTSKIKLIHLPPYCPNLNLIERLWKFMRKKVINTTYYSEFGEFKNSINNFFLNIADFSEELKSFIGLKMHVVRCSEPKTNLA